MPIYHSLGDFPHKRHTQFRKKNGELYSEELFSTEGFSSLYGLLYHVHPPTKVKSIGKYYSFAPDIAIDKNMQHRSFQGFSITPEKDWLKSRKYILVNNDIYIALASPSGSMDYFFKNVDADEMLFIHEGEGTLHSAFGQIDFVYGDYVVIPRGIIYQIKFKTKKNFLLIAESFSPILFPKRYRNDYGQLLEHSPFCERDIKKPKDLLTFDQKGEFKLLIKKENMIHPYFYETHPFDVIGWDGYVYPWAFSIHDFEPITGRVHQPPPVHQTFEARNFVVCSFCPRLFDYHPQAIPAPYNHSNIDSDEVLYYVAGNFMSRKNVKQGQITLHPLGIPHGPHPGAVEKSIGAKSTEELAVMIDTFRPLKLTKDALKIMDSDYHMSWAE